MFLKRVSKQARRGIFNGFINEVPNHGPWFLIVFSANFVFARLKVKGLPSIIVMNIRLNSKFIICEPR